MLYISNYSSGGGSGTVTNIATGTGLTGGPITSTGTIALSTALAPMATLTGNALKVLRVNAGETAVEYATISGTGTVTNVSSANSDISVANPTSTPTLTLNSDTAATASTIVKRDASINIYSNNYFPNTTSTVSSGGTTVLTIASSRIQRITGSSNHTFQLPNATTLPTSSIFEFDNNSSGTVTINNNGGVAQYTLSNGGDILAKCTDNSTANGTWDFHPLAPSIVSWSSGVSGLQMNNALNTTALISSGAASSTAPVFVPQRVASTTGLGGDGTNLYGIISGVARLTISASGITATNLSGTNTGDQTSIVGITGTFAQFNTAVTDAELARTDAANTFTGTQTITQIDLGNTDTSITRSSAGIIAVEGVTVPLNSITNIHTAQQIELGNASDTTITRTGAGAIAVEGVGVALNSVSLPHTASQFEVGNASDTTITRSSAGVIAVEGVVIPSISSTNTFTNKRITSRVGTTTSSATPTINTDNVDYYSLTAQTVDITSFTTNLSGTPTDNQKLWISITGTAARAITWGASFESSTATLPTTTVSTNRLDVGFVWNAATSKWRCVATA